MGSNDTKQIAASVHRVYLMMRFDLKNSVTLTLSLAAAAAKINTSITTLTYVRTV